MSLLVEVKPVPPFMENSYVVGDSVSREAFLVDPGGDLDGLAGLLDAHGLRPIAILGTHGHIDHVSGVAGAKRRFGVPFWIHRDDERWIQTLPAQATWFRVPPCEAPAVDRWLEDGDELALGALECRVLHTPGHSEGGCCFYFASEKTLLTGDTLFAGSIGRTDFPGGSAKRLVSAIREKLFPLGDDVVIWPGHGPRSTLGEERRSNPFVRDRAST